MSLHCLVTGRASSLKISAPITNHEMYFPSILLPLLPSLLLSLDIMGWCYTGRMVRQSVEKLADPGSPGSMAAKPACVCIYNYALPSLSMLHTLMKDQCCPRGKSLSSRINYKSLSLSSDHKSLSVDHKVP